MGEHLPSAEEIADELTALVVKKDFDGVSERLQVARQNLVNLIKSDPEARELVRAAKAEFVEYLGLRALVMGADALDTLEKVMNQEVRDPQLASATVRAATEILDRGGLPKQARTVVDDDHKISPSRMLPDLDELVENAGDNAKAHQLVDQYMAAMKDIEAMRRGAREIIEGEATVVK